MKNILRIIKILKLEKKQSMQFVLINFCSIDLYVRCFTVTNEWSEWLKVKERLAVEVKKIVESNGASFAFPSTSIYVEKK